MPISSPISKSGIRFYEEVVVYATDHAMRV